MKPLDLRLGNPQFLASYWSKAKAEFELSVEHLVEPDYGMSYEREGGRQSLKDQIRELHAAIKNADASDKHVVIGNGATQMVVAALWALKKLHDTIEVSYAREPYWFRFTEMAQIAGVPLTPYLNHWSPSAQVEIVTIPSNPENVSYPETNRKYKIHDLCYQWPQYAANPAQPRNEEIMIFGLAKATGHGGSRVGWALVKDEKLATLMAKYIELTSGGVSVEAQDRAEEVIKDQAFIVLNQHGSIAGTVFQNGKEVLEARWKALLSVHHPKLTILNSSGMFAWITYGNSAVEELEADLGILAVCGLSSGGTEAHARITMGSDTTSFEEFIRRLNSGRRS